MGKPKNNRSNNDDDALFNKLGLILALMAVTTTVALDLLNHFRGERSYIFGRKDASRIAAGATLPVPARIIVPAPVKASVPAPPAIEKVISDVLSQAGLDPDAFDPSILRDGTIRFTVRLDAEKADQVGEALKDGLAGKGLKIGSSGKTGPPVRDDRPWLLTRGKQEKAELVFLVHKEPAPSVPSAAAAPESKAVAPPAAVVKEPPAPTTVASNRVRPKVALIMDDMGEDLEALSALLDIDVPVTIAILPESAHAAEAVAMAGARGREVILHLPLEAINGREVYRGTDGFITTAMSRNEIIRRFRADLSRVPHAVGVNNHMGSRFTTDPGLMKMLLSAIKAEGLFFIDSRTIAGSVGFNEARKMGLPTAERDVFLDADEDRSLIRDRLVELLRTARKQGAAIGICHPFPETIEILRSCTGLLDEFGLEAVPVSRLVR